ncbi:unnamed protein product [Rotaria magnacalcarata]|nr:unnamed protein product [Rotaria magnacalcarata]
MEAANEDDYSSFNFQKGQPSHKITDSWLVESHNGIDDKNILNKLQLLQNRIRHIEQTLARRQGRDRIFYTCVIGYFLLQALLSVRRSMLN